MTKAATQSATFSVRAPSQNMRSAPGRPRRDRSKGGTHVSNDDRKALVALGVLLIAGGHKLLNAELGKLGAPHAVGAVLVGLALRS